ncbi:MAG: response regulator, partial [Thiohalomonadales bacterium]
VYVEDRDYVRNTVKQCYMSVEPSEFEFRVKTKSEEIRWIYAILRLEKDKRGIPRKISGILQNISARKISEERAQLLQMQLQQSQKMEAIGQLTGGIAHDFNNILAAIMGYTGLALDRCMDGDSVRLKEYLDEVYHAGERATDLITQMMTFSRTSINEPQNLSIIPVLNEVCKMLASILPSSIRVSKNFEKNLPNILIDPIQLQQVIMNICINARDAMTGKGELLITVKSTTFTTKNVNTNPNQSDVYSQIISCESCHEIIKDESYLQLSIGDNGQGIKSSDWFHLFEPFFTTKDVGKGTGMGLSMVHGIVHEHNGHILIDSCVGKGTTFKILFPCISSDVKPISPIVRTEVDAKPSANKANILVVDDEESMARYIAAVLEKNGHHVTVFTSSKKALQSYQREPGLYDLLVTDQTMPELTGAELSKAILAYNSEFPIILCTGYSESLSEDQAIRMGIKKYLYKPVETATLLNVTNDLLAFAECSTE